MINSPLFAVENLSIFDPVSPAGVEIRNLSFLIFAITGAIFVVVETILIYSIIRFRRAQAAAGQPAAGTEPAQVYGSTPIEIAWTAAPALIVFVIMLVTLRTLWAVAPTHPDPEKTDDAVFVTVAGRQWWWEYRYDYHNRERILPDGLAEEHADLITANELHIPVSDKDRPRRTYLTLTSADVSHSYWVPRLHGKTDLIPGRTNFLHLETTTPGVYVGQCAEFCGTQHAGMLLRVSVDTPEEFEKWLDNEKKVAVEDPSVADGKQVFLNNSCVNCHRIRGTTAKGNYAPDLTHLMARKTLAAGLIENNAENLDRWVENPQSIKNGCLMPAFGLSEHDRKRMVAYLLTLK
jgi:cytochrome c oxidase subunit 2